MLHGSFKEWRNLARRLCAMHFSVACKFRTKNDLPIYVLWLGLFTALGNISLWAYLPKYVKKISWQIIHPFKDIKTVWSLFIPTIAVQIYTVLDKTMIGLITESSFENGYYEQAIKIAKMLLAIVTALGVVMIPRIGQRITLFLGFSVTVMKK